MLAPSKATPRGLVPTVKVPRSVPSLARNLVTLLTALICHPDVGPVKGHACGVGSHSKGADERAIARGQFGHVVAGNICHPDVGAVKGDGDRVSSHGKWCRGAPHRLPGACSFTSSPEMRDCLTTMAAS